jgi:hypothetical protein
MKHLPSLSRYLCAGLLLWASAAQAQIVIGQSAGFTGPVADGVAELTEGAKLYLTSPPRQNRCRLDRTKNPGAAMKDDSGSIRTSIQRQSGGQVAAAGERLAGGGLA